MIKVSSQKRSVSKDKIGLIVLAGALLLAVFVCLPSSALAEVPVPTPFIAWSPDGTMLAVSSDTTVEIIDAATMQPLNTLTGFNVQKGSPAWSPDGTRLAILSGPDVEIWQQPWSPTAAQRLVTYRYYASRNPPEPSVTVWAAAWSPDGTRMASSAGGTIYIWQAATGVQERIISGMWDWITQLIWTPDNRLTMANNDATATNLNPDTGEEINYYYAVSGELTPPGVWAIAFSPNGDQLVLGTSDGLIQMWGDTRTSETKTTYPALVFGGHTAVIFSLSWSPDGSYIASGSGDGTVRIWDAATGEPVEIIDFGPNVDVKSVAWSPDGSQLVYGKPDGTIEIISAPTTPQPVATSEGSD